MDKTAQLGTAPIGKLLFRLALPAVAAQIINILYNMVDRVYIGRIPGIGPAALTGVGVCMPITLAISAFAALVSMGGAPRASIKLGEGDKKAAGRILGGCTLLLILLAAILTAVVLLFGEALLLQFGASENTIGHALDYILIYAAGSVFVLLSMGLNAFITAQGYAGTSMLTITIGAVCNIILDPIFIFLFGMGVKGAALATIISQAVSCVWVLLFLTGKKPEIRLETKNLRLNWPILAPCLALGLSPFVMQITESLIIVCFNSSLLRYGSDIEVGAMTIILTVMQFAMLPLSGFAQGAQPIISYNFGARNADRVKSAFLHLLRVSLIYAVAAWACAMLAPGLLARLFTNDTALIETTVYGLRIYMAVAFMFGIQTPCQHTFIAIGNAAVSLFLAVLRKIILLIPLIYLLPNLLENKVMAVFLAEPLADFLAVCTTATLFFLVFRRTLQKLRPKANSSPTQRYST